uniref:Uncharacterized protein n=1 Tax=Arundo donax TaxID=35708 RepID=A0A0A9FII4_ARUDO
MNVFQVHRPPYHIYTSKTSAKFIILHVNCHLQVHHSHQRPRPKWLVHLQFCTEAKSKNSPSAHGTKLVNSQETSDWTRRQSIPALSRSQCYFWRMRNWYFDLMSIVVHPFSHAATIVLRCRALNPNW